MPTQDSLCRSVIASPLGDLTLEASPRGLRAIHWGDRGATSASGPAPVAARRSLAAAEAQLAEYFAGRRREFTLPLDWRGTPFQQSVWRRLLRIPYGATVSYADVARSIGHPRAFRAVGGANRSNPIPIVVPCHRVIGASGDLTGYAGRSGLHLKQLLLDLETARRPGRA